MNYKKIKKMPAWMFDGPMDWSGRMAHLKKVADSRVAKKEKRKERRRLNREAMER